VTVQQDGLQPVLTAARSRLGLIAMLLVLAVLAWWFTVDQVRGMDIGPGAELGPFTWFLGVWLVMMAAMMFPSVAPTVALYSTMTKRRTPLAPLVFSSGYLLTWTAAGLLAFAVSAAGHRLFGEASSWDGAGRWLAAGVLLVAAVYELTPLKSVCLRHCRSPLGSCSAPGATACLEHCEWVRSTAPGASDAAGR
jgi:predicted metal-binding membrane protein